MVNLEKKVVGIDVSSKFLTVSFKNEKDQEMVYNVSNLKTGINGFLKKLKTIERIPIHKKTKNRIHQLCEVL